MASQDSGEVFVLPNEQFIYQPAEYHHLTVEVTVGDDSRSRMSQAAAETPGVNLNLIH